MKPPSYCDFRVENANDDDEDDGDGDDGDDEDEDSPFSSDSDFELRGVDSRPYDVGLTSFPVIRGASSSQLPTVRQSKHAEPRINQSKAGAKSRLRKPPRMKSLLSPGPLVNSLGEILLHFTFISKRLLQC